MEQYTPEIQPQSKFNIQPKDVIQWGLVIVGGIVIYKTMTKLGLINTLTEAKIEERKEELEQQVEESQFVDWTSPVFWKKPAPAGFQVAVYPGDYASKWAGDMYATDGFITNDKTEMTRLLRSIEYRCQYSFLAYAFSVRYGKDLTTWLKEKFSTEELAPGFEHLNKQPLYKKK